MKKNPTTLSSFIWQFVCRQKVKFFFIVLLSFIWTFDLTFWPYLFGRIIDTMTSYEGDRTHAWDAIKGLLLAGALILIFVEFCFRARDFLHARFYPRLEAEIRTAMFDHIQHHSPRYFHDHFAGSLGNKVSDMVTHLLCFCATSQPFLCRLP